MEPLILDPSAAEPPFEQLRAQIARRVAEGSLEAGARLPTVRALAADTGLALNTVARVYRELEADQVVVTQGRRGTFVASGGVSRATGTAAARYATAARRAGLTRSEAVRLLEDSW